MPEKDEKASPKNMPDMFFSGKLPRPKARNPKVFKSRLAPKSDRLLAKLSHPA
jgi:hypothetical protein